MSNRQEEILQAECVLWFNNTHLQWHKCLFAITNNSINKLAGSINKAKGVKSGVSDLCLICPDANVVWIEMKTPTGTQDPEQKVFQKQVESLGHLYIICRAIDHFKQIISQHFDHSPQKSESY